MKKDMFEKIQPPANNNNIPMPKTSHFVNSRSKTLLIIYNRLKNRENSFLIKAFGGKKTIFDIDCTDPLGRTGLVIAIENENMEMMQFLIESGL